MKLPEKYQEPKDQEIVVSDLYCWGSNFYGKLSVGHQNHVLEPTDNVLVIKQHLVKDI